MKFDALGRLHRAAKKAADTVDGFALKMRGLDAEKYRRFERAMKRLTPEIRGNLLSSYDHSTLHTRSGRLRAAVAGAWIQFGKGNIRVSFARGLPDKIYAQGSSLQYGAVHSPKTSALYRDLPTGEIRKAKKGYRRLFGSRAKRTIKRNLFSGATMDAELQRAKARKKAFGSKLDRQQTGRALQIGKGISVRRPHPFFVLTPAKMQALERLAVDAFADECKTFGVRGAK